jgi:hypothetical protein
MEGIVGRQVFEDDEIRSGRENQEDMTNEDDPAGNDGAVLLQQGGAIRLPIGSFRHAPG